MRSKSIVQKIILFMAATFLLALFSCGFQPASAFAKKISKKERNRYFAESAFVGNSISVGLQYYFETKPKGYLGEPLMLAMKNYSFANDASTSSEFRLEYEGRRCSAKEAIAASGVKRAFINMGTNDMGGPARQVYKNYVKYIKGIQEKSPGLVIFIQSMTPTYAGKSQGYLNNKEIRALNALMEKYCKRHKDMYYVDISRGMTDERGGLKAKYCSDSFVHITMYGYEQWTDNLTAYIEELLLQEKKADTAVNRAKKHLTQSRLDKAEKMVSALGKSTVKDNLKKRLQRLKRKWKKIEAAKASSEGEAADSLAAATTASPSAATVASLSAAAATGPSVVQKAARPSVAQKAASPSAAAVASLSVVQAEKAEVQPQQENDFFAFLEQLFLRCVRFFS